MLASSATLETGEHAAATAETKRGTRELPLLTRDEIARKICAGSYLFIHHDLVINASSWSDSHPGGVLAILHFVGRDATNEVEAYHSRSALERVKKYAISRVEVDQELGWKPLTPPITLGLVRHPDGIKGHWRREGKVRLAAQSPAAADKQVENTGGVVAQDVVLLTPQDIEPITSTLDRRKEQERSIAYQDLKKRIEEAGLFRRPGPLAGYGSDIIRYISLGGAAFSLYFLTTGWLGQMASALLLGLMWQQLTFLAHDAGHMGVTGTYAGDRIIGTGVAGFIGGLSIGWWCDNHNVHHLVTNELEHDPDIQHIPFFAISKHFGGDLWSTYYKRIMAFDAASKVLISLQHKLYYVVLSLARFNLYALSYTYLLGPKPKHNRLWYAEILAIASFWVWFGSMLRAEPTWQMRLAYLAVSHIAASPVHVQIVLSHFACSTDNLGPDESFPSRQLRTTMDVICSPNIEFIHGGLHLQVTHHLFPRMPRHNLRKASLLVKEYCKQQGIDYQEHGWLDGNRKVLSVLAEVAQQIQLMKKVADSEIDERMR